MTCTTSLSIYSTLSPPSISRANTSSSSSSSSSSSFSSSVPVFVALRTKPTCPFVRGTRFSYFEGPKRVRKRTNFGIKAKDMTITEIRPEEEEEYPPLLDPENNSRPRRIALFVEPSPFAYGNLRFSGIWAVMFSAFGLPFLGSQALYFTGLDMYQDIKIGSRILLDTYAKWVMSLNSSSFMYLFFLVVSDISFDFVLRPVGLLSEIVMVVTTHEGVPEEFYGAKLIGSRSFPCPLYQKVPLSLALSPRIISEVARFKPDIIHASSPGIMASTLFLLPVFGALIIAKLLCVPIVMSYHTHVPVYIPRYTFSWLVRPMWLVIKFLHRAADLTLVPSAAIQKDLQAERVAADNKIRLWNKGVDSESFHPRFRSHEMRIRLSNGEPEKPLIVHVGRIGVEKSLDFLKSVMDSLPEARIAFIGDGPYREELEKLFSGMPAVFTGMLGGEELSQAYASGDVFVMPSESETLGLVVLEAMSSGIPVVGARAGGVPDIIPPDQEGKIGYLYNPGDLEDCLSKLKPLLYNHELRETMGIAARQEMEKYDWKAATRIIRNEQYNAAIWFWRKKRAQMLRPVQWLIKLISPSSSQVSYR
ncbi:hypothetical protein F8388_015753 [Cannabis sativa]|uniref:Uncharacterized protein n=1 Tax=Cannabis sativa TaxID=3483 RepID=A0A7J6E4N8_CANSA|nr:hypothetical protein F8388_015753 [Cannabis sativa]